MVKYNIKLTILIIFRLFFCLFKFAMLQRSKSSHFIALVYSTDINIDKIMMNIEIPLPE